MGSFSGKAENVAGCNGWAMLTCKEAGEGLQGSGGAK